MFLIIPCTIRVSQHWMCAMHTCSNAGEDDRAGRWWWEDAVKKERGLHVNLDDKMESNDG